MTTYKESGVDIDAGEETVRRIKPLVRDTFTPGVLADIGSFGSFFELDLDGIERPVLVSSVDGVGTKIKVATRTGRYDTVGQDLVNHCVNDIAVCGARPLYFLDYYATSTLEPATGEAVVQGFATACAENDCALVGGEIAEMPDVYAEGEFDLVGSIVGLVDKAQILNGDDVAAGDVLLGLPSTGLHTNGYTLARTVLFEHFDVDDAPHALGGETVGEALLRVHRSYLEPIQALVEKGQVRACAHITGGGLAGNTARVIPDGLQGQIDFDAWARPPLFALIQERGDVPEADMRRTFNCGIGLVAVVAPEQADAARATLEALGEEPVQIGKVVAN
jgi:phosphoribosylformylglycinamidine cyclo-ligase